MNILWRLYAVFFAGWFLLFGFGAWKGQVDDQYIRTVFTIPALIFAVIIAIRWVFRGQR